MKKGTRVVRWTAEEKQAVQNRLMQIYQDAIEDGLSHIRILEVAQETLPKDRRRSGDSVAQIWSKRNLLKMLPIQKISPTSPLEIEERQLNAEVAGRLPERTATRPSLINEQVVRDMVGQEVRDVLNGLLEKASLLVAQNEQKGQEFDILIGRARTLLAELDTLVPEARKKLSEELLAFSELVGEHLPTPTTPEAAVPSVEKELAAVTSIVTPKAVPENPKKKIGVYGIDKRIENYLVPRFAGSNLKLHCYYSEDYRGHRRMETGVYEKVFVWTRHTSSTRIAALRKHYGNDRMVLATGGIKSIMDAICREMQIPLDKELEMHMA